MKLKYKFAAITFATLMSTQVFAMAKVDTNPTYDGVGCTREYDPVPYTKKDGTVVTANNPCIAAKWAAQGL